MLLAILIVIFAVGGFFAGIKYQQGKSGSYSSSGTDQGGRGQFAQRRGGQSGAFRPTTGEIVGADATTMTVKLQDGSTKLVLLSDKTQINKAEKATKDDLKNGVQVAVFGTTNADGSITAQTVQLNPQLSGMRGRQPNQSPKSPDAKEIVVQASNYKFSPTTITVKQGEKTRIVLKNSDGMHDFKVDELNIATAVIQGGQEDFVEFTADKPGQYEFYCSVGNHRQMGMKGKLIVQ